MCFRLRLRCLLLLPAICCYIPVRVTCSGLPWLGRGIRLLILRGLGRVGIVFLGMGLSRGLLSRLLLRILLRGFRRSIGLILLLLLLLDISAFSVIFHFHFRFLVASPYFDLFCRI